jgi:hypothetical protein
MSFEQMHLHAEDIRVADDPPAQVATSARDPVQYTEHGMPSLPLNRISDNMLIIWLTAGQGQATTGLRFRWGGLGARFST